MADQVNPFAAAAAGLPASAPLHTPAIPAAAALPIPVTQTVAPIDEVDFDSDVQTTGLDRFPKMKKDEVARIAFLLFNDAGSPQFKSSQSFSTPFNPAPQAVNVSFIAPKDNQQLFQACVNRMGEPKLKFGTIVLQYNTDQYGNVLDAKYKLIAYIFGSDKWNQLKPLHKEWGLQEHDLIMTCADPNFQKISFQPAKDALWKQMSPAMQAEVIGKARQLYDRSLNSRMGFVRKDEEIIYFLTHGVLPNQQGQAGGQASYAGAAQGQSPVNPFGAQQPQGAIAQQAGVGQPAAGVFADLVAQATQSEPVQSTPANPAAAGAGTPAAQATPAATTDTPVSAGTTGA
jgi:hypothetical protein